MQIVVGGVVVGVVAGDHRKVIMKVPELKARESKLLKFFCDAFQ